MFRIAVLWNIAMLGAALVLCSGIAGHAGPSAAIDTCTVLISSRIKPYMEAVGGFKQQLEHVHQIKARYLFIKDITKADVLDTFTSRNPAVIAVGPEALVLLNSWQLDSVVHKFFTMVLDPGKRIPRTDDFCGIFLAMAPEVQIPLIQKQLPWVKKLGILFDPVNNSDYVTLASATALNLGFEIVPIQAGSRDNVPGALRANWEKIDALMLIPDSSIISSSLVTLIIKEGISNRIPVIGYNHFFFHNGALMAFVYNYREIGKQTADQVILDFLSASPCSKRPAGISIKFNEAIARQLKLERKAGP